MDGHAYKQIFFFLSEKGGILKKPGPYGPIDVAAMEKEKWLEENADRLSRLDRLDRLSMSSQNQLAAAAAAAAAAAHHDGSRGGLADTERTLKSLNGYHEGILEALRSAANSHRGSNSSCSAAPGSNSFGGPMGPGTPGPGHHRSSAASLTEELRKTLAESYFDYNGVGPPPPTPHVPMGAGNQNFSGAAAAAAAAAMAAALKSSREKLDGGSHQDYSEGPGLIRIRNLEDLIRQLEHRCLYSYTVELCGLRSWGLEPMQ